MKIAIVGWGVEGQSAYRYFGPDHEYLIVNEHPRDDFPDSDSVKLKFNPSEKPPGITSNVTDLTYLDGIEDYDQIIYSVTSVKNLEKHFGLDNKAFWNKAKTVQHIFFEQVKTKNLIGVTGSKGKGTTSTLIYKLLETHGVRAHLAGNIGTSVLDILNDVKEDDWAVLELTSYQLYKFPYSPHIAVCLMITEEHLDWHTDMNEYIKSKTNLFAHQKDNDVAIYFADNEHSAHIASHSKGVKIPYFQPPGARVRADGMIVIGESEKEIISRREVGLPGAHNLQNICAALTAVQEALGSLDGAQEVLSSFTGLEHRLELVRTLNNVKYYDDSFGTTPDTAIVALQALVQPVVMILGGHDKGLDYTDLIKLIAGQDRVRHIITIGLIGPKLAAMLRDNHFTSITEGLEDMKTIVAKARDKAEPGDAVLLSCGTSSFGLFKDYKDRGEQFRQAVLSLV